ncbi:nucleotidyltransferase [Pararcticibacter amylolyticus]|uniref:Nucleotidyltransferase n=2 Tax=Pararcticibacter amylolyticus TaxID=2173175 RepID=A0A2U2PBY3_9SPHI|nr:nucleotidyltransferase [Pararcticibacter amylolyticus]
MQRRYMAIWFPYLMTDRATLGNPQLSGSPLILVTPERNRIVVKAANRQAEEQGIRCGMTATDARAVTADLHTLDYPHEKEERILRNIGLWCIRYTPFVAIDLHDGLILDISGCTHLWGDERGYLKELVLKLRGMGYYARGAIADTVGTAWAVARFGNISPIVSSGEQAGAISSLPPEALRLDQEITDKLHKLGFHTIGSFMSVQRTILRRRFGESLLLQLARALGSVDEHLTAIVPPVPYEERLPCPEPVYTPEAIETAIEKLLESLCPRLQSEGKGVRKAVLKCFRADNKQVQISISTIGGSHSISHLFKLFCLQTEKIEPAMGIELFLLEAQKVEDIDPVQEKLWAGKPGLQDHALAELLDRIAGKIGPDRIKRYLPSEHYWPERSVQLAASLNDKPQTAWYVAGPRPVRLLSQPEPIEVMSLLPDYPPRVFSCKGKRHIVTRADGPERIEQEWWLGKGEHRDYYAVEDEEGLRYWLFRSGHYDGENGHWYLHGYFA